jgi:hypothetical protein
MTSIKVPILNTMECVEMFPDELPVGDLDYNDLIDVMRSELAPLSVWRACAVSHVVSVFKANTFRSLRVSMIA